jgi:hypothetical protein
LLGQSIGAAFVALIFGLFPETDTTVSMLVAAFAAGRCRRPCCARGHRQGDANADVSMRAATTPQNQCIRHA